MIAMFCMQVLKNAVLEAKNAACDVQNSIADQKQMLVLSAQQHEEVGIPLILYLLNKYSIFFFNLGVLILAPKILKDERWTHLFFLIVQGNHKSLMSAHEISRATIDFFNNLSQQATKLMAILEENHKNRSHQLAAFEKNFKVKKQ